MAPVYKQVIYWLNIGIQYITGGVLMADAFTSETYDALCRDAEGYLSRGLAEQARELLLKATSLIGTRSRARSLLADACMQLTLWDEAKSQLEALATLEVDNVYTHYRLGQVLEETGDYELARDNFQVVLDMNPDHHGAKVSLSRLEKISEMSASTENNPLTEGQQIFADSAEGNGVFAEDSTGEIDELLNNIGMGEKKDVPGVEDLLNSIGMNHREEKKEEKPAVDFASIFGGSDQGSGAQTPLADVFNNSSSVETASETAGPDSVFGEKETEEQAVEYQPPVSSAADFSAIFGDSPSVEEPAPDGDTQEEQRSADLGAIFGDGSSDESTPVEESAVSEPVLKPEEPGTVPVTEAASEQIAIADRDADDTEAGLNSVFGGTGATETAFEEEDSDFSDRGAALPDQKQEAKSPDPQADLEVIFSESLPSEEPSPYGKLEEASPEVDLSSMFGAGEPETTEEDSSSDLIAEPSKVTDDTDALLEPVAAEESSADLDEVDPDSASPEGKAVAAEPVSGEIPAPEADEEESTEPADALQEEKTVEEPAEIVVEVPVVEESSEQEPEEKNQTVPEPAEEQTAKSVDESVATGDSAVYTLLPGNSDSLCTLKLETGSLRVLRAVVVATDGSLSLEGDLLSGNGMAWMGQGNLSPIVVKYTDGMTVRIDRVAARPSQVSHEACGIGSVPSLCRLGGSGNGNSILMFVTGRTRKLTVTAGLKVRGRSVVTADPGVSFTDDGSEYLAVSGKGVLIITG
jgi:hypothetical protein